MCSFCIYFLSIDDKLSLLQIERNNTQTNFYFVAIRNLYTNNVNFVQQVHFRKPRKKRYVILTHDQGARVTSPEETDEARDRWRDVEEMQSENRRRRSETKERRKISRSNGGKRGSKKGIEEDTGEISADFPEEDWNSERYHDWAERPEEEDVSDVHSFRWSGECAVGGIYPGRAEDEEIVSGLQVCAQPEERVGEYAINIERVHANFVR